MKFDEATGPKCASAKVLKSRPHPSLLRVISRKGKIRDAETGFDDGIGIR